MAFEPNFNKVVASVREKLGDMQSQVECKLPTMEEVNKIICSSAKANIVDVSINGKEVVYSGFVNFQIIYLSQNQEPVAMDYTVEFKDKYQSDIDLQNIIPVVTINVIDVNTVVTGDIKAVAILETSIDIIRTTSTMVLIDINGKNYYSKKEKFNYSQYIATISNKFDLNNDVEIKDGVSKVLSVCPSVCIDKVVPSDRFLTIYGGVYFDICYLTDNNIIRSLESSFEFTQEVAHEKLNEESVLQNILQILYNDIKVTTSIDTDSAVVNIVLPLMYEGCIFENNSVEVIGDLYSTNYFNNLVVESIESMDDFDPITFSEKLNGNVLIQENDPFIDEVLGNCCSNVVIANSSINNNQLTIEGVATITVLYLNKETNTTHSLEVEMPFLTSKRIDVKDGANTSVQVTLTNISTRARRGKEIEVLANLDVYTETYSTVDNAVITQVIEEDEIVEDDCAMLFYITKDKDTVWEISKELRISTEKLLAQNPMLFDPIQAGTRVVVYRQRQVEF